MARGVFRRGVEHAMGTFGLLLIVLISKLADCECPSRGMPHPARAFLARRAMDGIAAIGWTVDRLSGYPVQHMGEAQVIGNEPV